MGTRFQHFFSSKRDKNTQAPVERNTVDYILQKVRRSQTHWGAGSSHPEAVSCGPQVLSFPINSPVAWIHGTAIGSYTFHC